MAIIKPGQLSSGPYSISGSFSGSFAGDGSNLVNIPTQSFETGSFVLTSSFNAFTGSYNTGSFTGSFTGSLLGVASTASYVLNSVSASYSDVANSVNTLNQNVLISGSLTIVGNSTFYGSSSFVYVTASQLAVSASFISVNVFEPAQRFGGLIVYDSGSSLATASLAWDSLHNHWIYQNVSGATYTGGMLLAGPRNTGSLGDEPNLTQWYIPRGDGGDHLNDSQIYSSASIHIVTGSLTVTQGITGSLLGTASYATQALSASFAPITPPFPFTGSALITGSLGVTGSFIISSSIGNLISVSSSQIILNGPGGTAFTPSIALRRNGSNVLVIDEYAAKFTGDVYTDSIRANSTNPLYFQAQSGPGGVIVMRPDIATLSIGYYSTASRLDILAQGTGSSDISFRVRNNTNTRDNFRILGNGQGRILANTFGTDIFSISYVTDTNTERDAFKFTNSVQNAMGRTWTFNAGYNGAFEGLIISNDLTGNNQGQFSIQSNNYCFGTTILNTEGSIAERRVIRLANGVAPTTSKADEFKFYSSDITAGNAAPHFRTENGSIIKLYQQSAVTSSQGLADALTNLGFLTGSSTITSPTSTILYNSTSPVSVTGTTDEILIASIPIPTNISDTTLRASFVVVVTTLGGAAPRTRMRIGTIANPTAAQLSTQTQLGTNAIGSANAVSMYRTMPVVGGVSGNIKVIAAGGNVNADYGVATTYDTISVDWTTQQYIYFTIINNTTAAVTQCYGVLLEQLKQ